MMVRHGHVIPNADGSKARCGGPSICSQCAREFAAHGGGGAGVVKLPEGETPATAYQSQMIAEHEGVAGCARCGGTHENLDWKAFGNSPPSDAGKYTAWAACPVTGDPILFEVQEVIEVHSGLRQGG